MRKEVGVEKKREEDRRNYLMVKERKMQWRLKRITKEERRNKRAAWVKYTRIRMGGRWDKEKEILIDGRKRRRDREGKGIGI